MDVVRAYFNAWLGYNHIFFHHLLMDNFTDKVFHTAIGMAHDVTPSNNAGRGGAFKYKDHVKTTIAFCGGPSPVAVLALAAVGARSRSRPSRTSPSSSKSWTTTSSSGTRRRRSVSRDRDDFFREISGGGATRRRHRHSIGETLLRRPQGPPGGECVLRPQPARVRRYHEAQLQDHQGGRAHGMEAHLRQGRQGRLARSSESARHAARGRFRGRSKARPLPLPLVSSPTPILDARPDARSDARSDGLLPQYHRHRHVLDLRRQHGLQYHLALSRRWLFVLVRAGERAGPRRRIDAPKRDDRQRRHAFARRAGKRGDQFLRPDTRVLRRLVRFGQCDVRRLLHAGSDARSHANSDARNCHIHQVWDTGASRALEPL